MQTHGSGLMVLPSQPWPNHPYKGIDWMPWQKKFAWSRVKLSSGRIIWMRFYYTRRGRWTNADGLTLGPLIQNGTLFDVLKGGA